MTFHLPETSTQHFSGQNNSDFSCSSSDTSPLWCPPPDLIEVTDAHLNMLGQNQTSINNYKPFLWVQRADMSDVDLIWTSHFHNANLDYQASLAMRSYLYNLQQMKKATTFHLTERKTGPAGANELLTKGTHIRYPYDGCADLAI